MNWFKKKIQQAITKDEFNFKKTHTFSQRQNKRKLIDSKYSGSRERGISYLVIQKASASTIKTFTKPYKLFAIENNMKIIDLIAYIRNNLKMTQKQRKTIANSNSTIGQLHQIYSEPDGFLYVTISESEVF